MDEDLDELMLGLGYKPEPVSGFSGNYYVKDRGGYKITFLVYPDSGYTIIDSEIIHDNFKYQKRKPITYDIDLHMVLEAGRMEKIVDEITGDPILQ